MVIMSTCDVVIVSYNSGLVYIGLWRTYPLNSLKTYSPRNQVIRYVNFLAEKYREKSYKYCM